MGKHKSGSYRKAAGPSFHAESAVGGAAAAPALKARGRIAHIEASADQLEALDVRANCPACGQSVMVEVEAHHRSDRSRDAPVPVAGSHDVQLVSVMRNDLPRMTPETPVFSILGELAATRAPFAVVVDADGAPKGVLTALDLYAALEQHGPGSLADLNVLDATRSTALTLRQDTRMSSVVRLFLQAHPDCILAVDESGRLSGVVTQTELLSHVLG